MKTPILKQIKITRQGLVAIVGMRAILLRNLCECKTCLLCRKWTGDDLFDGRSDTEVAAEVVNTPDGLYIATVAKVGVLLKAATEEDLLTYNFRIV